MKVISFILSFLLMISPVCAQKKSAGKNAPVNPVSAPQVVNEFAATDKIALQLPDSQSHSAAAVARYINAHFASEDDKARATFIWIASAFQYDVDNMFAINFYEKKEERVAKTFATRKGICADYAAIFNDVCGLVGIRSFVVSGYTKQNGMASYIPHAWCVAFINNDWFVFDPTWGSGYVSNGRFVNKINDFYFKAKPADIIDSHMPFDPLWECLNYLVTNADFYSGKTTPDPLRPFFSYKDSIDAWVKQSPLDQYQSAARRIEQNGMKNSLVYDQLVHVKSEIERCKNNVYNEAAADYTKGVNEYNEYIQYYNHQFKPQRPDPEIQAMIDSAGYHLATAKMKLGGIREPSPELVTLMANFLKSMGELQVHIDEQKEFLAKYFSKGKLGRKGMFTKYTWMGIPLN